MALDTALVERTLVLSAPDRGELIRKLILSLETPDFDMNADALWTEEFRARIARFQAGDQASVDWRDSAERIRQSLKRDRENEG